MTYGLDKLVFTLPIWHTFKDEKSFTAWFWKKIHDMWGMRHKISDMSIDSKPADSIISFNWISWLLEIKHWREKTKVDIGKKLRMNQHFWLNRYQKNGGTSIVIYYNEFHHKYWIFEYKPEIQLVLPEKKW